MTRTRTLGLCVFGLLAVLTAPNPAHAISAITAPGTADRARVGDVLRIAWTDLGTGLLHLHYQKGGTDTTWYSISSVAPATPGEYKLWQVLPLPGTMRIRATMAVGSDISYYHSGIFNVVQLDVGQPGFLTSWAANSTQNITWTYSNNAIPFVRLEYALNGADSLPTWVTIRDSVPISPASFAWTVPNSNTSYARVRIREVNSNSVIAVGNAFAITGATGIRAGASSSTFGLSVAGSSAIRFTLSEAADVKLEVLDAQGSVVAAPMQGRREAGSYTVSLDGNRLPAGMYTVRLRAGGREESRKLVTTP